MTANRSMPSASATLATYVAADATSRPGDDADPPYPGRSYETQRMPSRADVGNRGAGGAPVFGVPMVPEHGEAYVVIRARVVHVQRAAVAQLEIRLTHGSGVMSESRRRGHPASVVERRATIGHPAQPEGHSAADSLSGPLAACAHPACSNVLKEVSFGCPPRRCWFSLAAARLLSRWGAVGRGSSRGRRPRSQIPNRAGPAWSFADKPPKGHAPMIFNARPA
jgi:hypothetical protein